MFPPSQEEKLFRCPNTLSLILEEEWAKSREVCVGALSYNPHPGSLRNSERLKPPIPALGKSRQEDDREFETS